MAQLLDRLLSQKSVDLTQRLVTFNIINLLKVAQLLHLFILDLHLL